MDTLKSAKGGASAPSNWERTRGMVAARPQTALRAFLKRLWRAEQGQELTEYVLLLAALALCTAGLVVGPMSSVNQIWVAGNNELSTAASATGSY